jgi:hypothetical protein
MLPKGNDFKIIFSWLVAISLILTTLLSLIRILVEKQQHIIT